jgi:hypothetical protein
MTDRAYTVKEIDALRACCDNKYLWGNYNGPLFYEDEKGRKRSPISIPCREPEKSVAVEEMVRTFMLAGKTADELIESELP